AREQLLAEREERRVGQAAALQDDGPVGTLENLVQPGDHTSAGGRGENREFAVPVDAVDQGERLAASVFVERAPARFFLGDHQPARSRPTTVLDRASARLRATGR